MASVNVLKLRSRQVAELMGISMQALSEWSAKWLAPAKVGKDSYLARLAIELWVKNYIAPPAPDGEESAEDAKRRYEIARANKEELRVKRESESLVPRGEAILWVRGLVEEAKTAFLALPRRLAPELFGADVRNIEGKIDDEIKRVLRRLARPAKEEHENTTGSESKLEPAGKPDRQPVGRKKPRAARSVKRRTRPVAK